MTSKHCLIMAMKNFFGVLILITLSAFVSCQKQQSEAEKNAEVERQVQERLAAERQAQQQQQLDQRQAELDAREKSLAEKGNAAAETPTSGPERVETEAYQSRPRGPRENAPAPGYSTFYTKLEPYGAWLETSDYGYVWQPREVESSAGWRPYTNGRWVYTDVGWTWISEEPFGWATYHYGRWTRLRGVGWVWVPGNEWAPAWVSWRKSNDYVGWAPLPPEARFDRRSGIRNWSDNYYDIGPDQYCFVPTRQFGAQRIETTIVPAQQNVSIVNQTTNVTNITYNNTTIVNEGPSYDELRSESREPIQRFRLERNVNVDVSTEPPRPRVQGETIVVAAPLIAVPQPSDRPPTVKRTIAQVAVDLGWAAIANHEEAKKARAKMKLEATPPPNAPPKKFVRTAAASTPPTQAGETSATSPTPVSTPSAAASAISSPEATSTPRRVASPSVTAAPERSVTPRRPAQVEQSPTPTPLATSTPSASAAALPTASQGRERLLVPNTPAPRITPIASPRATAFASPTVALSPSPAATAIISESPQKFGPRTAPPTNSPPPSSTSTSSASAAASPSSSAGENLTKKEKKEQKREEKKELKRERREGLESATPSP